VKARMTTADVAAEVKCLRRLIGMRLANVYDVTPKVRSLPAPRCLSSRGEPPDTDRSAPPKGALVWCADPVGWGSGVLRCPVAAVVIGRGLWRRWPCTSTGFGRVEGIGAVTRG
jgi:hypothetical protein